MSQNKNVKLDHSWSSDEAIAGIVKHSPDYAILLMDRQGEIQFANRGAERILASEPGGLVGTHIRELFTPEDAHQDVPRAELKRALLEGRAEDERWHCSKDGRRFWASGVVSVLRNQEGEVAGFSKVFRDKTRRKETQDEIKRANSSLLHFSHTVAHDLQAPLRSIILSLQAASRKTHKDAPFELTASIESSIAAAKHMSTLISDLLSYSQIGRKQDLKPTHCNGVFDMAIAYLKPLIDESLAAVTREALPQVWAVPTEVEQVFQNLITNAIKYKSGDKPTIHIEATLDDSGWWRFSVTDNGIGIEPENRERIFDSFERIENSEDRPGTGLGLAICKRIIETYSGKIWVDSTPGKGSTFFFTLPAVPKTPANITGSP